MQLLNHEQVKQLKIIQFNNPRDSEKCCVELFDYWLQVDSTASWSKLITALQYIDHDVLASKIKRMISKGSYVIILNLTSICYQLGRWLIGWLSDEL